MRQGALSIEALKSIGFDIETRLVIFVEDLFAKKWLEALRELPDCAFEVIEVHFVMGDGNALKMHKNHSLNPSVKIPSLCFLDGDSRHPAQEVDQIYKLPGGHPEFTIFNSVVQRIEDNIALLTAACQRPLNKQDEVRKMVELVGKTNRDPHLLYSQIGINIGQVSEEIVRGAFIAAWIDQEPEAVALLMEPIVKCLKLPLITDEVVMNGSEMKNS